jgi:GT2 family glycosyltransferase
MAKALTSAARRSLGLPPDGLAAASAVLFILAFVGSLAVGKYLVATAILYAAMVALAWVRPRAGIWALAIFLPIHTALMVVLYIDFHVPVNSMSPLLAWKEAFICLLLGSVVLKAISTHGLGYFRVRRLNLVDWSAISLSAYLLLLFILPSVIPLTADHPSILQRFYGLKTYLPLLVGYGLGRLIALDVAWIKRTLVLLVAVGTVTAIWAVIERFTVPLSAYISFGYLRFLKDVAHITYNHPNGADSIPNLFGLGNPSPSSPGASAKPPWWALPSNFANLGFPENFATDIGVYHLRRAVSTYLSSQPLAISFIVLLPLAMVACFYTQQRKWILAAVGLMSVALLLSISRAPIATSALALAVVLWGRWSDQRQGLRAAAPSARGAQGGSRRRTLVIAGSVLGGLALVVAGLLLVMSRRPGLFAIGGHSTIEHLYNWWLSLQGISHSPIFGSGLGTTGLTAERFSDPVLGGENQFLLTGQETGLIGMGLYGLFTVAGLIRTWQNWRSQGPQLWRLLNLGVFAALLGITIDSLTAPVLNAWFSTDVLAIFLGIAIQSPSSLADGKLQGAGAAIPTRGVAATAPSASTPGGAPSARAQANAQPLGVVPANAAGRTRIGVVVVTYNGLSDTRDCLDALTRSVVQPDWTIVVDNASTDGTCEYVRERYPGMELIPMATNTGFCHANNVGIETALAHGADFIMLLNNDAMVQPDTLGNLCAAFVQHPEAGIIGPRILFDDDSNEVWWSAGAVNWIKGQAYSPETGQPAATLPSAGVVAVPFIPGTALVMRADLARTIGTLDPAYWAYWEDVDLCMRARGAGFGVLLCRNATMRHRVSRTAGHNTPLFHYLDSRNRLLFMLRRCQPPYLPAFLIYHSGRVCWRTLKYLVRGQWRQSRAIAAGTMDCLRRHFGAPPAWAFRSA